MDRNNKRIIHFDQTEESVSLKTKISQTKKNKRKTIVHVIDIGIIYVESIT